MQTWEAADLHIPLSSQPSSFELSGAKGRLGEKSRGWLLTSLGDAMMVVNA
jgi:hypothetical protein